MSRLSFLLVFLLIVPRYDCCGPPCVLLLLQGVGFLYNTVKDSRCNVALSLTLSNNLNDHLYLIATGSNGNFEQVAAPGLIPAGGSVPLLVTSSPEFGRLNDKELALIFKYGSDKSLYLAFKVIGGFFAYTVHPNWDESSALTWWGPGSSVSQSNYRKLTEGSAQFGIIIESIQQRWAYTKNQCVSGNINIVLQGSTVRETRFLNTLGSVLGTLSGAAENLMALKEIADIVIPEGLFSSTPTKVIITLNNGNNKDMACTYSKARNLDTDRLSDNLSISGFPYVKSGDSVVALVSIFESSEDVAEICYRVDGKTGWGTCIQVLQTDTFFEIVVFPDFKSYNEGYVGYTWAKGTYFQKTELFDKVRGNTGIGGFATFSGLYDTGATMDLTLTFYDISRGFTVEEVDLTDQQLRATLQQHTSSNSSNPLPGNALLQTPSIDGLSI